MVPYPTDGIPSILKGVGNPIHLRQGQNDTSSNRITEKRVRLNVDGIVDITAENARSAPHVYMGTKENLEYEAHSAYTRQGAERQTIPGPHSPRRVSNSQVVKMRLPSGPLLPAKSLRHLPERSIPAGKHNLQVALKDATATAPEAAAPSNLVLLRGNLRQQKEPANNVRLAKMRLTGSEKLPLSTMTARQEVDLDRPLPPRPIAPNTPPFSKRKAVPTMPPHDSRGVFLSRLSSQSKDDQSSSQKRCVFPEFTTSAYRHRPPSSGDDQQTPNMQIGRTGGSRSGSLTDIRGIDDVGLHGSASVQCPTSIVDDGDIDDNFRTLFRMLETDFPELYDVELELDSVRFAPIAVVTQEPIDRMIWPRRRPQDGDKPVNQRLPEVDASEDDIRGKGRQTTSKSEELLSSGVSWERFPSAQARTLSNRSGRPLCSSPHVQQVESIPTSQETSESRSPVPGPNIAPSAGIRVREAVQNIEQKTAKFPIQSCGLSTPIQRAILARPSLVDSAELTRGSKELMEKVRQDRVSKGYKAM